METRPGDSCDQGGISEPIGPANRSQPFSSRNKSNVIGGWLPSLTSSFGDTAQFMSRLIDKQMNRAIKYPAVDSVQDLLVSGNSINHHHGKDGFTPLMGAAFKGDMQLVQFLLIRGVDPDQTAKDGASALFWASVRGHEPVVELLIAARADVNAAR